MRVIIAGSRTITDMDEVKKAVKASGFSIHEVVSGGATGVDRLAEQFAARQGVPLRVFKADWGRYSKMAGIIRNEAMCAHADALVAVWDGLSLGTDHCIKEAKRVGLKVHVHKVKKC